jgi:hypothetical protein
LLTGPPAFDAATVGYGDFRAYGVPEAAFTIFYMALNLAVGAYIVSGSKTTCTARLCSARRRTSSSGTAGAAAA